MNETIRSRYETAEGIVDELTEDEKDLNYVHDQPVASTTWTIIHNLNKKPSVRIEDLLKNDIMGEIDYTDNNTVTIQFAIPVAGSAYLN